MGALLYFFATRLFGQDGSAYLGLWRLMTRLRPWLWFPTGYILNKG